MGIQHKHLPLYKATVSSREFSHGLRNENTRTFSGDCTLCGELRCLGHAHTRDTDVNHTSRLVPFDLRPDPDRGLVACGLHCLHHGSLAIGLSRARVVGTPHPRRDVADFAFVASDEPAPRLRPWMLLIAAILYFLAGLAVNDWFHSMQYQLCIDRR